MSAAANILDVPNDDFAVISGVTSRSPIFNVGDVLSGVFEVREIIGEGGMGQVFEARDRLLNRRVAIKAAWPHARGRPIRIEAQALAALRHESVVAVFALGEHDGIEYAVMERISGTTLEAKLDEYRERGEPFPIDDALVLLASIADGLAAVHGAGIAHFDVKPANVMLAPRERVVLTDFGIFRSESDRGTDAPVSGTPQYMAPERFLNAFEPRDAFLVDVYAFGVLAFEVLTGRTPFHADTPMAFLKHHMCDDAENLCAVRSDAPAELGRLVRELLAKEPTDRPQSMEAVAHLLRRMRA
jgi:serine/threonine-protein kinase